MTMGIISECVIVSGSRPTAAQCAASTARLCSQPGMSTRVTFHSSANSAAIRIVRFSPRPPITMRSRSWVGNGYSSASRSG